MIKYDRHDASLLKDEKTKVVFGVIIDVPAEFFRIMRGVEGERVVDVLVKYNNVFKEYTEEEFFGLLGFDLEKGQLME